MTVNSSMGQNNQKSVNDSLNGGGAHSFQHIYNKGGNAMAEANEPDTNNRIDALQGEINE